MSFSQTLKDCKQIAYAVTTVHWISLSSPSLLLLEDGGSTHTSADTHAHDTVLALATLEFGEDGGDLASTSATERVAERDGTAEGVDLGRVETEDLGAVGGLRCKRLVDLKDVDLVLGNAGLLEGSGDGLGGSAWYFILFY